VTRLTARPIFSQSTLARLNYDEPVSACDAETGIELFYRFEHGIEGRLRLTGGPLSKDVVSVGCDPDDINLVATLLLDGLKFQLR
jgi:hypothetical protein